MQEREREGNSLTAFVQQSLSGETPYTSFKNPAETRGCAFACGRERESERERERESCPPSDCVEEEIGWAKCPGTLTRPHAREREREFLRYTSMVLGGVFVGGWGLQAHWGEQLHLQPLNGGYKTTLRGPWRGWPTGRGVRPQTPSKQASKSSLKELPAHNPDERKKVPVMQPKHWGGGLVAREPRPLPKPWGREMDIIDTNMGTDNVPAGRTLRITKFRSQAGGWPLLHEHPACMVHFDPSHDLQVPVAATRAILAHTCTLHRRIDMCM